MNLEAARIARTWLGTPYHHQARVKGVGVDCAQLMLGIAEELCVVQQGIIVDSYTMEWHLHNREERMINLLLQFGCTEIETPEIGDILAFKFGRVCSHLGIYIGDQQFIHARLDVKSVVLNTLSGDWLQSHKRTFSFPTEQIR
jgi:NlpC/P60 family putative phage cell wall peptidase